MKITGTKKLLLIFLALIAVGAACVCWGLSRSPSSAAAEEQEHSHTEEADIPDDVLRDMSEDYYDESILHSVADQTGIDYDLINFYAHTNGANAGLLYADLQTDDEGVTNEINSFLTNYSLGKLTTESDIEDEDWYVAPDDVSTYDTTYRVGLQDTWTAYSTSKSFITTENQYWGLNGFTMGPYARWPSRSYGNWAPEERFLYTFAWLNEGESYTFGLYSTKSYQSVTAGAMNAVSFINTYLTNGYWFPGSATTSVASQDPNRRNLSWYRSEYATSIEPSSAFLSATDLGNDAGWKQVTISKDAPSGVYYIQCTAPYNNGNYRFTSWNNATIGAWSGSYWCGCNPHPSNITNHAQDWSWYARYVVIVKRAGITAPKVVFEEGVDTNLTSKTVTYNGSNQYITLSGDWGPGLSTLSLSSGISVNVSRPTAGSGKTGNVRFTAKDVGKYTITLTPFKAWADGTTAAKTYTFEIKKRTLNKPEVVPEEGVNQATNSKYVYETGKAQYISMYPVPKTWMTYSLSSGLSLSKWTDNGVLTIAGTVQGKHSITVSFKDPANMQWPDGTNAAVTFTFEIGPMKINVPDIIKGEGVDGSHQTKRVTYDGSMQTISFMPVNQTYMDITCPIAYTVESNVMIATVQDAGTYVITIAAKPKYIWETESKDPMTFTLIIDEAEIDLPVLINDDKVGNTRTVTYGGEKVGDTNEDWVATLDFDDCNELAMSYVTTSLNQKSWGDRKLVLAGRYAGTYSVSFSPNKNYKWKNGVDGDIVFSLTILPMRISIPKLVREDPYTYPDDGYTETGVWYDLLGSTPTKKVDFCGTQYWHSFKLFFDTSEPASKITYAKSGSIETDFSARLKYTWPDNDNLVFTGNLAERYELKITPSVNYRWDDESEEGKSTKLFVFYIQPIGTDALGFEVKNPNSGRWEETYNYNEAQDDEGNKIENSFFVERYYDGTPHTVRIGGLLAGEIDWHVSYINPEFHSFQIVDEKDDIITDKLKEKDWWNPTDDGGYLTLSFVDAGTYRIRVSIRDTNFCWKESNDTAVLYTVLVHPKALPDPTINKGTADKDGNDRGGQYTLDSERNTMFCVYFNVNFSLYVNLAYNIRDYVKITAPDLDGSGRKIYDKNNYYPEWIDDCVVFTAIETGDWTWIISIEDPNYSWTTRYQIEFEFTIHISRAGVSGVELHFLGSDPETPGDFTPGVGTTLKTGTDMLGGSFDKYDEAVFNEAYQYIYIVRTNTDKLVNTGFSTQFSYEITCNALESGYDNDIIMYWHEFDDNGLKLYALNAGVYTISITPTKNYAWKDPGGNVEVNDNLEPVVLTFKINKLTIEKPLIIDDGDGGKIDNVNASSKTITYNRNQQPFTIGLIGDDTSKVYTPYAYKLVSFTYLNGENASTATNFIGYVDKTVGYSAITCGDLYYNSVLDIHEKYKEIVRENKNDQNVKVGYTNVAGGKNLAAQLSARQAEIEARDKDYSKYTVWAQSSGEYRLVIQIDNINNYQWPAGMEAEECTYFLIINQLGVSLPEAYLLNVGEDPATADANTDAANYSTYFNANGTPLNPASFYRASFEYDSLDHYLYIVGGSIKDGDFVFSWDSLTSNGRSSVAEVQPEPGVTGGREYYRLTASKVNTYTISINFNTHDFYWTDQPAAGSIPREFELVVSTKLIEVPVIRDHELEILKNNSYTINFPYQPNNQTIVIKDVNFGENSISATPDFLSTATAKDTNRQYSFINARIKSNSAASTAFDVNYADGLITLYTSRTATDAAQVPDVYCIELYLDTANLRWNTAGSGDTNTKYYYINIEKAKVEVPFIEETKTTTGSNLYVTYTGDDWVDRLEITGVDSDYVGWTLSDSAMMTAVYTDNATPLKVSAPAPVNTYTVTIYLLNSRNMEWTGLNGSTASLSFNLIVQPIKVAKPYIRVYTTEDLDGIEGWKRTVSYNGNSQLIEIGNIWKDDPTNRWMTLSFSGSTFEDFKYQADYSKAGTFTGEMEYNSYNNGLFQYKATYAGTYTVTVVLTNNAVWADGSRDSIAVSFVIEKLKYKTPYIFVDGSETDATYSGTQKKSYTYALDPSGNALVRNMRIMEYDANIMQYAGVASGTIISTVNGDGYIVDKGYSDPYYSFEAFHAGKYEVVFELLDFANTRWEYANVATITFTLNIERMTLDNPFVNSDYKLDNEEISSTGMFVDYDKREHTILLENIVGNFTQSSTDAGLYESYFLKYKETTDSTVNSNSLSITRYDTTDTGSGYLKVRDIFGANYSRTELLDDDIEKQDILTLLAQVPGTYVLTVYLADTENMQWSEGGAEPVNITLLINKVEHDAPRIASNTSSSQEYAGGDVYFQLDNVINGVMEEGKPPVFSQYEEYELVSYTGPDTSIDANKIADINANFLYQHTWNNGRLVLKMSSIGVYTFKVSIKDPDYVAWKDTDDTEKFFTFTITKRTITGEFSFESTDEETNASLQTGSTQWAISTPVKAVLAIKGLRTVNSVVDQVLDLKLYYVKLSDTSTELSPVLLSHTDKPKQWFTVRQGDGTYTLYYEYEIPYGRTKISKDNYLLYALQTDTDGNYTMSNVRKAFTIVADPAPFKTNMLEWSYEWDTDFTGRTYLAGAEGKESGNRLHLPYLKDNGVYTFTVGLNREGMDGFDKAGYTDIADALKSWKVTWDGLYGGNQKVKDAGTYEVYVTITALDPDLFAFDDYRCTLYIEIDKALYDLTGLGWDYDGSAPFEFLSGTNRSVNVIGNFADLDGLTVYSYSTSYTFTSGNTYGPYSFNGNVTQWAGEYLTTVRFTTTNSNYVTPVQGNTKTYIGNFDWTRSWTINKQMLDVEWASSKTVNSNGDVISYPLPKVDGAHANKFNYYYYKQNASGQWVQQSNMTRVPGQTVNYQVRAALKSYPNSPSIDYARNYEFEFTYEENPMNYTLGNDDTVIFNHIEINGKTDKVYEYTGSPFVAQPVIDVDTSNGEVSASDISVTYYSVTNLSLSISAPVVPGKYKVKLKLRYTNASMDYKLSEEEFDFEIIKASFRDEEFSWHIKHQNDDGEYEACYDASQSKWINVDTNEEVKLIYDGYAYNLSLVSTYGALTITTVDGVEINAGDYTSTARFSFNANYYNPPTVTNTFDWHVDKAVLDLSLAHWSYEQPFTFDVAGGVPKTYYVEMLGLPSYLSDKVTYVTAYNETGSFVTGPVSNSGTYHTEFTLDDLSTDQNYLLGDWPSDISKSLTWKIERKQIKLPQNDGSWLEFDGLSHNISQIFGFDVDWEEYFTVELKYKNANGGAEATYDGKTQFGDRFLACNAGTYTLELELNTKYNSFTITNLVWAISDGDTTTTTVDGQTVTLSVAKRAYHVTGWDINYESSHVRVDGDADVSKFIEYRYFEGDKGEAGATATLDDVLASMGGDIFSMVPFVKEGYGENVDLTFDAGQEFIYFTTREINLDDLVRIEGKPYIYGYTSGDKFHPFANDADIVAEYTGSPITFSIYNWETRYSEFVEIHDGDDLTQTEAGTYSVTLILKSDGDNPYYWGFTPDGKIDRSSVRLEFTIKYKMLTIPVLPEEKEYNANKIDILSFVENKSYSALIAEYGDYVEITGNVELNVGTYKMYLKIKDDYSSAVRWNDGSPMGLVGTYSFVWTINPILLTRPVNATGVTIVYDGEEHTVFEVLKGYDPDGSDKELIKLMEHIKVTADGFRSIDAGDFAAAFSLPNNNYSWINASGEADTDRDPVTINWSIDKFIIDFSGVTWGYKDADGNLHEYKEPFVYTLENAKAVEHSVELINVPEIIEFYLSYTTDDEVGNSASEIGTYKTRVYLNSTSINKDNYEINDVPGSLMELEWQIGKRTVTLPDASAVKWDTFDGNVHDLMEALGFDSGWENYFDVTVEYRESDQFDYEPYGGEEDQKVGFSLYNGYYFGYYKLTISIKSGLNDEVESVVWSDGSTEAKVAELYVKELEIQIVGWDEDGEYSKAKLDPKLVLSDDIAGLLEHVVYDPVNPDIIIAPEKVIGGTTYNIELRVKPGSEYGIKITTAAGVSNPLEFGNFSFGEQTIVWVPIPTLVESSKMFTGGELTFEIKDWDSKQSKYYLSDREKMVYRTYYGVNLGDDVKRYVYLNDEDSLKATAAGTYKVVIRLLSQVNLSWYDPAIYTVNQYNQLVEISTNKVITAAEESKYYNRRSYTLTYEITKRPVEMFSQDDFEEFAEMFANLVLSYNASEQFITDEKGKYAELFKAITDKYGDLITFNGDVSGIDAKDYELLISLADENSSYWYTGETEEKAYKPFAVEGYELRYLQIDGAWKLLFVAVDDSNNAVKDLDGNYVEFNGGDYTLDANYVPVYKLEYVSVLDERGDSLLDDNGVPKKMPFFDDDGMSVYIDENVVNIEYVTENGKAVLYRLVDGNYEVYVPVAGDGVSDSDLYLARYERYGSGDNTGYKIPVTEPVYDYAPLFEYLTDTDDDGEVNPLEGVDTYLVKNVDNKYVLRQFAIADDGKFEMDENGEYIIVGEDTEYGFVVDTSVRYILDGSDYTENENGVYVKSSKAQQVWALDKNGNRIVDLDTTLVKLEVIKEIYDPCPIKWSISSIMIESPSIEEVDMPKYTGKEIFLKDILDHFDEKLMEITGDVSATDVGDYEAQISLKGSNSVWADTEDEVITIKWSILPVTVSLEGVTWNYTAETVYTYERKGGKAVIYRVWLENLPQALEGKIKYTTNNTEGSNAGRDAGMYFTTFDYVNLGDNIEEVIVPEGFPTTCTWYIQRRLLVIPEFIDSWEVFDNEPHNLLTFLTLPEDWDEYFELTIEYSNGGDPVTYEGYDLDKNTKIEGNERYYAYGAGTYKFYFSIKLGINTLNTPNVVWVTGYIEPDAPESDEDEGGDDNFVNPNTESVMLVLPYRYKSVMPVPDTEKFFEEEELVLPPDEAENFDGEGDTTDPNDGEDNGGDDGEGEGNGDTNDPDPDPGDGDDDDDDIVIAPPTPIKPDDPNKPDDNYTWETTRQEITMTVGKYEILVEGWDDIELAAILNYNPPDKNYSKALEDRIYSLNVVKQTYWDINGNEVTREQLETGHTYFIHIEIDEKYADYISLIYGEDVPNSLSFTVPDDSKDLEPVPPLDTTPFEIPYTGEEIDFRVEYLNELLQGRNYLTIVESESDKLTQTEAGTYYVTIAFTDGSDYCWDNPSRPDDRSPVRLEIVVKPMRIEKISDLGFELYTGNDIDISEKLYALEGIGKYITVANGETDYIGKIVGTYSFNIIVKDEYRDSILWEDGTNDAISVSWAINPATISGNWNERGRVTFDTESTSYVGGYDNIVKYTYINAVTGEEVTRLVTGEMYDVEVELIDTDNFILGDTINPETGESENPYRFTLTVEIVTLKEPEFVKKAYEYTGSPITFEIQIDGKDISEYSEYVEIVTALSDPLTQTNHKDGGYKVVVRLKNGASWDDYGTDDWTDTFDIAKASLSGTWNLEAGTLTLKNSYPVSVLKYEYYYLDEDGEYKPISRAQMTIGNTYKVKAVLTDENNFVWAEGQETEIIFELNVELEILPMPAHSMGTLTYNGERQSFFIDDWANLSQFVELAPGSASLYGTNAGPYKVILKIKEGLSTVFEDGSDTAEVTFIINKVTLDGEWGNDGKVAVTTKGNYETDIFYIYTDANGETKTFEELQEGETYTAKAIPSANVDFGFEDTKTFTFAKPTNNDGDEGGSKLPWWLFLIIGLLVLLLIIIIIIIIILIKRRKDDEDDYDDYGDDEYYGDEYDEGDGDEGDYGDYGGDEGGEV